MNRDVARSVRARVNGDWSIFVELQRMEELERRAILRSHREVPFTGERDITLRWRLDEALSRVMLLELALETGLEDEGDLSGIPALSELLASSAFVRYLDAYLALSVRFVAERLGVAYHASDRLNELPVAYPCPPPVPEGQRDDADPAMLEFLKVESYVSQDPDVKQAMRFLDDYVHSPRELLEYQLWLRRLITVADEDRFTTITRGLVKYAHAKAQFYTNIERRAQRQSTSGDRPIVPSTARHPLTARFGLYDLYYLARLLQAEVSPTGAVTFADGSWLELLQARSVDFINPPSIPLVDCEKLLLAVLDYTCDLIQNAVEIANERLEDGNSSTQPTQPPSTTLGWRAMFDEELEEIERQRRERLYDLRSASDLDLSRQRAGITPKPDRAPASRKNGPEIHAPEPIRSGMRSIWSRRIQTGEHVDDLVGLAFSGGGIRSATFNLGVLQRLQDLDLLRQIDYLSTVSGGGYIGAWLLANVRRTRYWLTKPTDWSASIAHLRRYSNYLSPRIGLMSADSWTMWLSWIRNAALVQASAVTWLAFVMLVVQAGGLAFDWPSATEVYEWLVAGALMVVAMGCLVNIRNESKAHSERLVLWGVVLPAWLGAFVTSAVLWAGRDRTPETYYDVLAFGYKTWYLPLAIVFVGSWIVSSWSIDGRRVWRIFLGLMTALFSTGVVYLAVCAVFWLYGQWSSDPDSHVWYAYVFGPSLVLLAVTLGVVVMIGMLGRGSPDWRREWWTRFGSWIGIYGTGFLAISACTILGPILPLYALDGTLGATIKWASVLGWIATVIGGLLAGNRTQPDIDSAGTWKAAAVRGFARVAAVVFIVGAVCLVATLVHVVLVKISTSQSSIGAARYWENVKAITIEGYVSAAAAMLVIGLVCSWRFELNVFGLNEFYRNRLVRCYLGATRWIPGLRHPHAFTGFDAADDLPLASLRHIANDDPPYRGPFPIVNCSLNLGGSSDLALHTRHSSSFVMTPLRCGADRPAIGYAPAKSDAGTFAGGVNLGQAISVSGAAASPNMGYDTSPLVAFLLTMFNVRLAWWFPNPGRKFWWATSLPFSLVYLVRETFGLANENSFFVNVSDGGHFENLGIYELVRRRCRVIIAADAECDEHFTFGSLGRVIRMCETDFGAHIEIDVKSIRSSKDTSLCRAHCSVGRITYANGSRGRLIYLKASLTGDEGVDVQQYHATHPAFPHETTADQFFSDDQFESYRKLGDHVTAMTFRGVEDQQTLIQMAPKLENLWTPPSAANVGFVRETEELVDLWDRMRETDQLLPLFRELHDLERILMPHQPTAEELAVCLELIQLMENAFLELKLDDFWHHPDNRGWVVLFTMWARSPTFRDAFQQYRNVFGIRFGYFCDERLGLGRVENLA